MPLDVPRALDELEERIDKLKVRYEQYFLGIEPREPVQERRVVERAIRFLRSQVISNTALKFRFHALIQRFTTHKTYWDRVQRQIEEGTYRRDLQRIQRRLKKRGIDASDLLAARTASEVESVLARHLGLDAAGRELSSQRGRGFVGKEGGITTKAQGGSQRQSGPPPIPGRESDSPLDEERLRRLHRTLLEARRKTGQAVEGLTLDKLASTLAKQVPRIKAATGAKEIEFSVEISQGKAKLKAIPKK